MMNKDINIPPVSVGDKLSEKVAGFGGSGDPFVKMDKYVIFVKEAGTIEIGKPIDIEVTKVLPTFGFAKLV